MGDFGKDVTSIIVLIVGVAMMALLVGHAAGAGFLVQQGSVGLNTLLNTIELTNTANNGPNAPPGTPGQQGGVFSNIGPSGGPSGGLGSGMFGGGGLGGWQPIALGG